MQANACVAMQSADGVLVSAAGQAAALTVNGPNDMQVEKFDELENENHPKYGRFTARQQCCGLDVKAHDCVCSEAAKLTAETIDLMLQVRSPCASHACTSYSHECVHVTGILPRVECVVPLPMQQLVGIAIYCASCDVQWLCCKSPKNSKRFWVSVVQVT
jgi:hypothetical protein